MYNTDMVVVPKMKRPVEREVVEEVQAKGREGYPIYLIAMVCKISKRKVSGILSMDKD